MDKNCNCGFCNKLMRRKATKSRGATKKSTPKRTPRRGTRNRLTLMDMRLLMMAEAIENVVGQDNSGAGPSLSSNLGSPLGKQKKSKKATKAKPPVVLESDDEDPAHVDNVKNKMDKFWRASCLASDDEEDNDSFCNSKPQEDSPKKNCVSYELSDIEGDDCDSSKEKGKAQAHPKPETITSNAAETCDNGVDLNNREIDNGNTSPNEPKECDDVMSFLDSILKSDNLNETNGDDFKKFEEYRKETEALIKETSSKFTSFTQSITRPQEPMDEEEISPKKSNECPICLENLKEKEVAATTCGHIFCKLCIEEVARTTKKCPTCRKPITLKKIHKLFL